MDQAGHGEVTVCNGGMIVVLCEHQPAEDRGPSARRPPTELAELWRQQFRHDLRQPLMTATLLLDAVASLSHVDGDVRSRLMEIENQLEWMQRLLRQQEHEPCVRVVDIGETIAGHCTPGASGCSVHLVRVAPALTLVDPVELTRAARNLLDNATRAAGRAGVVEVKVARARATAMLEVADNGPGFGRIKSKQGHGLPSVRMFAERYGGRVDITRSSLGGTAVTIRLPLATVQA